VTLDAPYSLLRELDRYGEDDLPPVETWHPENGRDIDIRIDRDGSWYHEGTRITRQRLVRLFSTVLRREGDDYFLVTPAEKCRIRVDDAPFVVVLLDVEGEGDRQMLRFTTGTGDVFALDAAHPLRIELDPATGEPSPYVLVRRGLEARLSRPVYYQLAELLTEGGPGQTAGHGVWSAGRFHLVATDLGPT
jgi:hypothetical protein